MRTIRRFVSRIWTRIRGASANWEKWNAIGTLGLLALAIWIPFFSDLPNYLRQIGNLSQENQNLLRQSSAAQTEALRAQRSALSSQRQVNSAIASALGAETEATQALLQTQVAQRRVANLAHKADELTKSVAGLHVEAAKLASRNAEAERDLKSARATTNRLVDASISFLYSNRYRRFVDNFGRRAYVAVPTSDTARDQSNADTVLFFFLDRSKQDISKRDIEDAHAVVVNDFVIMGLTMSAAAPNGDGLHMKVRALKRSDRRFVKLVALMKSTPAIDLPTLIDLRAQNQLPVKKKPQVIDALHRFFQGRSQFALGFMPGRVGDLSYEDWLIPGFWISGVSDSLSRMSNALAILKGQYSDIDARKIDLDRGLSFDVSKTQWKGALKQIRNTFGSEEMPYVKKRLSHLQNLWLSQLSSGNLEFRFSQKLKLDNKKHVGPIFHRWSWAAPIKVLSVDLFDTLDETERADFVLECAAGEFLKENNIAFTPEVFSTLNSCRLSGTVAIPGARFMAFFRFVMHDGAPLPFPCSEIAATVKSPSGFKYEFHPLGFNRNECEAMVFVPAGEPITLTARRGNLVGRPASVPQSRDKKAGSPEFGWTNPTVFRLSDHAPSTHWRIVEMQQNQETTSAAP